MQETQIKHTSKCLALEW